MLFIEGKDRETQWHVGEALPRIVESMYLVHWRYSGSVSIRANDAKQAFTLAAEAFVREGNYFGEGREWAGRVAPCAGGRLVHLVCRLSHSAPFVSDVVEAR